MRGIESASRNSRGVVSYGGRFTRHGNLASDLVIANEVVKHGKGTIVLPSSAQILAACMQVSDAYESTGYCVKTDLYVIIVNDG
jgi:hypothetical protein